MMGWHGSSQSLDVRNSGPVNVARVGVEFTEMVGVFAGMTASRLLRSPVFRQLLVKSNHANFSHKHGRPYNTRRPIERPEHMKPSDEELFISHASSGFTLLTIESS
jgi:hypothetical protein